MSVQEDANNHHAAAQFRMAKALAAYALYILAFTCVLPFLPLRLLWRGRRAPRYRERIGERFGLSAIAPRADGIWVHSVSVGETLASVPTIKALQQKYPTRRITVTTTTPTGSEQVKSIFGDTVEHVYAPYDWPLCVWLFLRRVRPAVAIIVETELWPTTLGLCRLLGIPVVIANARLSEKSATGYKKLQWLVTPMLEKLWVAAQHDADAERFVALGADAGQVTVTGSVKFDISLSDEHRRQAEQQKNVISSAGKKFVWIAASTHEGEDQIALQAQQKILQQYPNTLLLLVPRHPERFNDVASLAGDSGFGLTRRSLNQQVEADTQVLLVDTMGELLMFYGVADIAFVGGSLVPVGGHNYIEPACWGIKTLSGPYRHNFAHIAAMLQQVGALDIVESADQLSQALLDAIENSEQRLLAGQAALRLIEQNRGADQQLLDFIAARLDA